MPRDPHCQDSIKAPPTGLPDDSASRDEGEWSFTRKVVVIFLPNIAAFGLVAWVLIPSDVPPSTGAVHDDPSSQLAPASPDRPSRQNRGPAKPLADDTAYIISNEPFKFTGRHLKIDKHGMVSLEISPGRPRLAFRLGSWASAGWHGKVIDPANPATWPVAHE